MACTFLIFLFSYASREQMNVWIRAFSQVVVFDSSIPVQLAFYALVEHGESLTTSRHGSG